MAAALTSHLLLLFLLVLVDLLVAAQRGHNTLKYRQQPPGVEFDVSSHLKDIELHRGFFLPVVEASRGFDTLQMPRSEVKEGKERRTKATSKRYISAPVMCGSYSLVSGEALMLATPNYPANYDANFDCTWSIKTETSRFQVNCTVFQLGDGDYFSMQYGNGVTLMYRGQDGPDNVIYPFHKLVLGFHSDCRGEGKGMSCSVATIDNLPSWMSYPECGLPNRGESNRITGGSKTVDHEYPWLVLLVILWSDFKVTCSGSLIHPQWVISATHCILRRKDGEVWLPKVTVQFGVVTREQGGEQEIEATTIIMHQKLNFHYDITLLKLERPVTFSSTIRPICLPPSTLLDTSPEGAHVEIAGWGNDESGEKSNELKVLERVAMSSEKCRPWFPKYITNHHICTYGKDRKHICVGDSGGAVMMEMEGRLVLLGITSFTSEASCNGTKPDGHISVPHFLDWIKQETGIELPV